MTTRITHQVRCRNKNDPQLFVDVEVLDAVDFTMPNGDKTLLVFSTSVSGVQVIPCIIDNTGGGNGKGDPHRCTRLSHMERMVSQSDPSQIIDVEILDAFSVQPPNIADPSSDVMQNADYEDQGGQVDSGDWNGAQHLFVCPLNNAVTAVVDKTGCGLSHNAGGAATSRVGHINIVTNAGNTDDQTQFSDNVSDQMPPTAHPFIATIKLDGINFVLPSGNNKCLLIPASAQNRIDTTKYVTDQYTGDTHAPPDNTDPNVYVSWPETSLGANLGLNPTSQQTGKSGPINQGIFWWIKKISGWPNPWYWYAPVQTPLAFSYFGSPGDLGSWPWRGFVLWNNYPVIWILSANNPILPMGDFGSPSLLLCAQEGDWFTLGTIPTAPLGIADGPFAPFGYLPVLDPPLATVGLNYQIAVPNIWELTGITQPNLANPNKPWDRTRNRYLWPSADKWEQVAKTFASNWQSVCNGFNDAIGDLTVNGQCVPAPPPGWKWAVPYVIPHGAAGYPFATWNSFQNGLQPGTVGLGGGSGGIPPEVYVPATCWNLTVDQLNAKDWDTTPSLVQDYGQLINNHQFGPPIPLT